MTKIKLSPAQKELLLDAPTSCIESYAPARKLVELGLATHKLQSLSSGRLELTPAGEELAAQLRDK